LLYPFQARAPTGDWSTIKIEGKAEIERHGLQEDRQSRQGKESFLCRSYQYAPGTVLAKESTVGKPMALWPGAGMAI
jgi:hypothetical protein